jgi:phospholipid/cholesterol/gamma-HCH transport system substrate-binding protein
MQRIAWLNGRVLAVAFALVVLMGVLFVVTEDGDKKTLTAHFPRAVSVYENTDVRILGVNVGKVTSVTPEGDSVRVEIEYDEKYKLPADAKAVIVTPTLVADRFVQLTPAYTDGEVMADAADIPLQETGVPVELDRIYGSLRDLTATLGPNGANADGTLNHLLKASARGLDGQGKRANQMIRDLAESAETFGNGSGELFDTVSSLAEFTGTLADNDRLVRAFMQDLAGVSAPLAGEREELQGVLREVGRAVGSVEGFVRGNREALVTDVQKLARVMKTINSERNSLDAALNVAPVAMDNLVLAYNSKTGSVGSRIGISPNIWDADGFLCGLIMQYRIPKASKNLACQLLSALLEPITNELPGLPPGPADESTPRGFTPKKTPIPGLGLGQLQQQLGTTGLTLEDLLGGAR